MDRIAPRRDRRLETLRLLPWVYLLVSLATAAAPARAESVGCDCSTLWWRLTDPVADSFVDPFQGRWVALPYAWSVDSWNYVDWCQNPSSFDPATAFGPSGLSVVVRDPDGVEVPGTLHRVLTADTRGGSRDGGYGAFWKADAELAGGPWSVVVTVAESPHGANQNARCDHVASTWSFTTQASTPIDLGVTDVRMERRVGHVEWYTGPRCAQPVDMVESCVAQDGSGRQECCIANDTIQVSFIARGGAFASDLWRYVDFSAVARLDDGELPSPMFEILRDTESIDQRHFVVAGAPVAEVPVSLQLSTWRAAAGTDDVRMVCFEWAVRDMAEDVVVAGMSDCRRFTDIERVGDLTPGRCPGDCGVPAPDGDFVEAMPDGDAPDVSAPESDGAVVESDGEPRPRDEGCAGGGAPWTSALVIVLLGLRASRPRAFRA